MRSKQFQDKCEYWMRQQAATVFGQNPADADDLALAKAVYSGSVNREHMTGAVMTNASIGSKIDAGTVVTDSDVEYDIITENKFHTLAISYSQAGLI